jgi:DinB superfamily
MTEMERLSRQYEVVMHGEAWHGDGIWKILDGIPAECAANQAFADIHTIWEIVMHMAFWEGVAVKRLAGQRAGMDDALNFPAMPAVNDLTWRQTLERFRASNEEFRNALSTLSAERVDELSAAGKRTFYDEAHGLIQHHVYHAGQIALLKKAFSAARAAGGL